MKHNKTALSKRAYERGMTPTFSFKLEGWSWDVYLLNPGAHVPLFGGSSRGLWIGKTASLVIRQKTPQATRDTEYEIDDREAWAWIAKMLRDPKVEVITNEVSHATFSTTTV